MRKKKLLEYLRNWFVERVNGIYYDKLEESVASREYQAYKEIREIIRKSGK